VITRRVPCTEGDLCLGSAAAHFYVRCGSWIVSGTACEWHLHAVLTSDWLLDQAESFYLFPADRDDPWLPPGAVPQGDLIDGSYGGILRYLLSPEYMTEWSPRDPGRCVRPTRAPKPLKITPLGRALILVLGLSVLGFGLFLAVFSILDYLR